jgi:hypothetical protein
MNKNKAQNKAKPMRRKLKEGLTCQASSRGAFYSFSWRQALALIDIFWFAYLHLCVRKNKFLTVLFIYKFRDILTLANWRLSRPHPIRAASSG